jgi:hypothetical protein
VDKDILAAFDGLYEPEPARRIEELHGTCTYVGLLSRRRMNVIEPATIRSVRRFSRWLGRPPRSG